MTRRRIAIVTPWYGPEATGGAETLARELASHLAATDDVTILTTTARSFHADWAENHFKTGRTAENGYDVLRFALGERNAEQFDRLNGELMQLPRPEWSALTRARPRMEGFVEESINSPQLEEHLRSREAARYAAVVFLPYLYGVVVRGIEAYNGPVHLIPCLHDEAYARLPRIEDAIHRAATLLFNSDGEAELALRIYGPGILHKSHVIGSGLPRAVDSAGSTPVDGPYFLSLGRRDATKGVDFLIEAFAKFRSEHASRHSLVLAGPGNASYHDPKRGIIDMGFVGEDTKRSLIRNAHALAQPSLNESYSRVIMEAWREGVPVIARAGCLATSIAVERSGGGLVAGGLDDWSDAFRRLETSTASDLAELGRLGAAYAAANSDWPRVIERFRIATGLDAPAKPLRRGKRVDQVLQTLTYGDAISDDARALRTHLRALGYDSDISARFIHPRVGAEAQVLTAKTLSAADALIYHHSISFNEMELVLATPVPKALIYHNITPATFFRDYDPVFADLLENGRAQLARLNEAFTVCGADSEYNARELREAGFRNVMVVPIAVNFTRFDTTPVPILAGGGGTQVLFVGRISPNKGIRQLIEAFEVYLSVDPSARLVLVGAYNAADRYFQDLMQMVVDRSLDAHVIFTGVVDEATLTAHYRNADLYLCLSEHEGFCVPLVEAMFFDIPVVARACTAVEETLGDAGVLIDEGADAFEVAAVVHTVLTDDDLRERIVESQRGRRTAFLPERVFPIVDAFFAEIV